MTVPCRLLALVFSLLLIALPARAIDAVYISEFVASNQNGLRDEDGDTSDWVEIYNSGATAVNLAGWRLTDDSGDLNQWVLPAVSLDPKGFLVVFASEKNRVNPAATLHTNFKLSADGGYLALVKADGSIAHEYNLYPAQYDDRPFGLQQTVATSLLIASGGPLKWLVPTSGLPTNATWTAPGFNATSWANGANGVGFETTVAGFAFRTYFANVGLGNIATANQVIATPSMQTQTFAETRAVVNYLDTGGDGHYAPQSNPSWASGNADNYVVEATGVMTILAAGVWTFGVNSDDGFQFQVRNVGATTWTTVCFFDGGRGVADTLGTCNFSTAGDYEVRVMIYEGGGGSAGEAFAKQGNWGAWDAGFKLVGDPANGGLAVKSVPIGAASSGYSAHIGSGSNLKAQMFDATPKKSSAYVRYTFTNPGGLTSLTMPIRYDDGFVAYLNGTEVARRNAPAGTPTNTSVASGNRPPAQALTPEHINLPIAALTPGGGNVLAIHGLNEAATSGDFLLKAELAQYTVSAAATASYFQTATPSGFNTAAIYNKVAPVTASVGRGFFTATQSVALATGTPSATIRYTLDGSSPFQLTTAGAIVRDGSNNPVPSLSSGVYTAPLTISATTTLRYAASRSGFDPSESVTQTYLFPGDIINQSPTGAAPAITNPPGAATATTTWPTVAASTQVLDYGMDPNVVGVAPYNGTITNDLKAIPSLSIVADVPFLFADDIGIYVNPSGDSVQWERPASLELLNPDGSTGFQINCGLRLRGGFSRSTGNPKHAFRFFFRDDYGAGDLKFPLFGNDPTGATTFDKFDLRCAQNYSWSFGGDGGNGIFVRDVFNRQTQLDMGQLSSHGGFYHLYLNGQYWGLFNIDERPEAKFAATYLGGSADDYDTIKVAPDNGYTIFATDGNTDAWFSLWSQADSGLAAGNSEQFNNATYQKLLGNNPDGTPNATFPQLLDAANVIDYNLCIYWGGNLDAAISNFLGNESPNNWFGFRDRTGAHGGFRFVLHDSEHTLLNPNEDRTGPWPAGSSAIQGANAFSKSTPQYLFQQCIYAQQFKTLFADRVFKHFSNGGALSPAAATARFDALTNAIDRAVVAESARWGDSKTEPALTRNGNWVNAVANTRNGFFPARTANVLAQFRAKGWYPSIDPPVWSQRGGTVAPGATFTLTLVAGQTGGTIYYTTDGSDPRSYNVTTGVGDIAPTAIAYAGPVTVATSTVIRTRVRNGTTWSALDEATFYTTQSYSGLALTEIAYNPLPAGGITSDDSEFLEFKNTTANTLDLGGLTFTAGITFTFPAGTTLAPGAFYVLARNAGQFAARYPGVTANAVYTGRLDNGGETLTIAGPTGGAVLSVTYADAAPWPAAADGNGFNAVPNGAAFNSDNGANWRASAAIGGSPRADDPAVNFAPIVINEALSNSLAPQTDSIEIHNPTGTSAAVGDWWLTDDPNAPKKFRIPAGTTIPAGGHVAFTEAQFNPTPGTAPSFALSSSGDDLYLFSGDAAGNLTGYSHGFTFSGAEANVSFGRYVNSVGDEHFPRQISRTFGSANAGPLVGPLVISEVMYNPYPGYEEFIEIRNLSGAAVNLFDPANPANTWRIGGLNWAFPTGQTIAAGGLALIVPIDPAAFRTKYDVPAGVPIYGPYSTAQNPASLDNGGERLSLLMSDAPVMQAGVPVVPYDYIDSVRFNDKVPWPVTADGGGPSLQRLNVNAYADDPANWFASGSTPGRDNATNTAPTVSLTAPNNNATYTLPANVTFQATASDTDGTIVKVEYYVDGGKVGEATAGPAYSYVWPATGGIHTVVAKAIDSGLNVTTSTPITIYATSTVTQGLKAEYFNNIGLGGAPAGTRTDAMVDFTVNNGWPGTFGFPSVGTSNFSVRWSGKVRAITSGTYTFYTQSDDGVRLYVNGQTLVNNWTTHGNTEDSGTIALTAGQLYTVVMEFFQGGGGGEAHLLWSGPSVTKAIIPQSRLYPDGPPLIITQPFSATREQGLAASFTVVHSGTAPFNYQWRKGGVNIPGATSQTLSLPSVLLSDAGQYSVLISNAAGFAISTNAALNVTFTDSDGDGMQNSWEIANGFNPNSAADAALDADGDGESNVDEFRAGTNPRNAGSKLELTLSLPPTGPGRLLSFTAQPYKSYTIQFKNGLGAASWSKLTDVESSAAVQSIQHTDTTMGANTERFYRVITPKQ